MVRLDKRGRSDDDDEDYCEEDVVDVEAKDITDLTKLDDITLQNVLDCLIERFYQRKYCTFAGSVLIAVNPCSSQRSKRHSPLNTYESKDVERFVELSSSATNLDLKNLEPHVLSLGLKSLYNIGKVRNKQVIVVSGDSGAGKTTCTQDLIKFFTYSDTNNTKNDFFTLEKKIYEATLILEALGNASTTANPNSSRFGRLVRLQYNTDSKIVGAQIKTYLLEKHRVAKGNLNERNFHIFHYLLQAIEQDYLDGRNKDVYDNNPFWSNNVQDTDLQKFKNLSTSLTILDLLDHFIQVFEFLFAIMHLLAIEFEVEDVVEDNKENLSANRPLRFCVSDSKMHHLASASQILGLHETDLHNSLIYQTFSAGNRKSISLSPCTRKEDCESRLHSFISTLYERLFHRIVDHLNTLLNHPNETTANSCTPKETSTVSILDLYGFENLDFNHFEQLCINYANERIQQVQISVLKGYFDEERRVSNKSIIVDEPMELNRVESETNLRLDEIDKRLFCILDEACLLKRPTQDKEVFEQLAMKVKQDQFIKTGRPHDDKCPFIIRHYASDVTYSMAGMILKNKDFIPDEFISLLNRSVKPFVSDLFPHKTLESEVIFTPRKGKPEGRKTILMRFKTSVNELVSELCENENRDVHFIKCIRPNADLMAGVVQPHIMQKQLFACGIVDIIRIAGNGYPIRVSIEKFRQDYRCSLKKICGQHQQLEQGLERFVQIFASESCPLKFGKSYVFMSENILTRLQNLEKLIQDIAAKRIQRDWRTYNLKLKTEMEMNKTPVNSYSVNNSVYFTPMTSGNSETFYSVGTTNHTQTSLNMNFSGPESPIEGGMLVSNCSDEEFGRQPYQSWINDSTDMNITTEGTITAYGTQSDIMSSTFLPSESEAESANVTLEAQRMQIRRNHLMSNPMQQMQLFCAGGVVSRTPVHTLEIKTYTKKTALGYIKPPKRLTSNGLADAFEEYGIVVEPILYPPHRQSHIFNESIF